MGHEVLGYHPKDLYSLTYRQLIFLYWHKQIDVRQADYNTYLSMWPHLTHKEGEQPVSIEKFRPLRCDPGYVAPVREKKASREELKEAMAKRGLNLLPDPERVEELHGAG
jgi:hypothetical protein